MKITIGNLFYKPHQRVVKNSAGDVHWRVGLTMNVPLFIGHAEIHGFGMQLGLTQAEVAATIEAGTFPAPLPGSGQVTVPVSDAYWLYEPAIAALRAAAEAKRAAA